MFRKPTPFSSTSQSFTFQLAVVGVTMGHTQVTSGSIHATAPHVVHTASHLLCARCASWLRCLTSLTYSHIGINTSATATDLGIIHNRMRVACHVQNATHGRIQATRTQHAAKAEEPMPCGAHH